MNYVNIYIVFNSCTSFYLLFWDFKIDWNVLNIKTDNFLLRDKISYPQWFYYVAIFLDIIFRNTWVISLYQTPGINSEMLFFILCLCEVYRRVQWVLIRVENEQLHNPESYRTHMIVPDLSHEH